MQRERHIPQQYSAFRVLRLLSLKQQAANGLLGLLIARREGPESQHAVQWPSEEHREWALQQYSQACISARVREYNDPSSSTIVVQCNIGGSIRTKPIGTNSKVVTFGPLSASPMATSTRTTNRCGRSLPGT